MPIANNKIIRSYTANLRCVNAAENTRGRRKHRGGASHASGESTAIGRTSLAAMAAALTLLTGMSRANPTGGQITAGNGTITQSSSTTTVDQSSQNLSVNWQSFSIGSQQTVDFVQPNAASIAVNRVVGTDGSTILGHLNANGQVYLINPNGIIFGKGAQVNVGGLVASALNLDTSTGDSEKFGNFVAGSGNVLNQGNITAASGGSVALLGNQVSNTGVISAQLGTVALGAGSAATLKFDGTRLVTMQIDRSVLNNLAHNGGVIQADGGTVLMTAGAKNSLLASVVNNTGVIEARTVEDHEGSITLLGGMSAGTAQVGGTLDASAPKGGGGGSIETSAAHVEIANTAKVTTAAAPGTSGTWLIDPTDFTVAPSGGDATGAQISSQLGNGNVTILSSNGASGTSGNVNVNDTVTWSANTLTLSALNNININSPLNGSGSASLALQYGQGAVNAGNTSVYNVNAPVNLPAGQHFSTQLGSNGTVKNFTVINSLGAAGSSTGTDLQGINGNSGNYALGGNIDASATSAWNGNQGFTPISGFSGTFDGLGHIISNLSVDQPSSTGAGLFGISQGRIQNVGLTAGSVTGASFVGILAGASFGTIANSYATGSVVGTNGFAGGLIGYNVGGTISGSHAAVAVSGSSGVFDLGGLVGYMVNGGTITDSYATGAVNSTGNQAGGLVGYSVNSTVSNSYATGSVTGAAEVGGLVGYNVNGATITNAYSTGAVSGSASHVGGLVGYNPTGTITNSYWDTTTSGWNTSGGGTGLTTTQMQTASNFSGFTFTTTPGTTGNAWIMVDGDGTLNNAGGALGGTFPMLASEYSNSIGNAHQLQLMSMAPTAKYTLSANVDASATGLAIANGPTDVWSTVSGFVPIGNSSQNFTGTFDGLGHVISGLSINRSSSSIPVGLFSATFGATVNNVGLTNVNITGNNYVGALMGSTTLGSATRDYATGQVTGNSNVGGLMGYNNTMITSYSYATDTVSGTTSVGGLMGSTNGGTYSNYNYATGNVTGSGNYVGGLVGYNGFAFQIDENYATGNVVGAADVGGLVGYHYNGNISDSYSSGTATGTSNVGGLVGYTYTGSGGGTVTNSFWNSTSSGLSSSAGGTALTNAQMQQQTNFTSATSANGNTNPNWNFSTIWVLYNGQTSPLLRGYMTPLTVTAVNDTITYSRAAFSGGNGVSYSATGGDGQILGTATYSGNSQGAINAGNYSIAPGGLYSDQQGYLFNYTNGTLSINQAPLSVSGTTVVGKQYDGTYTANLSGGSLVGAITGDTVTLAQSGTYASKDAGTSIAVTATDTLGGTSAGNYLLTQPSGLMGTITPAPLTVTGTAVAGKQYDGAATAALSGGVLMGVVTGDSVSLNQSGNFASKNVGNNIAVTANDTLSGASVTDYALTQPGGLSGSITPAPLTVTGTAVAGKQYNGNTLAALSGGVLVGVVTGDSVSLSQSGNFASKNAGSNIAVTASDTLSGASVADYALTQPSGLSGSITPAPLTVTGTAVAGKQYDGATTAALSGGVLMGVVTGDSVSLNQSGNFASKNVGSNIAVTASDTLSGASVPDYALTQPSGLSGSITPAPLNVTGTTVAGKQYDGTTTAALSGGALVGVVTGDSVSLSQSGNFASKNVGSNIAVTASDTLSGASVADYALTQPSGLSGSITPAPLNVTGTTVAGKQYDGTTTAALSGGALVGVVTGDSVSLSQSGRFASPYVGNNIPVTATDTLMGASTADYTFTEPTGLIGQIESATFGGLAVNAFNTRAELVSDTFAAQFSTNPQIIVASPGTGAAESGMYAVVEEPCTAVSDVGNGCPSSPDHKFMTVKRIGTSGTLAIKDGGVRLPSPMATNLEGGQ